MLVALSEIANYLYSTMKISKQQLKEIILEELEEELLAVLAEGLDPSKRHVFKKLKSGKWGKVYRPEGKSEKGDVVIEPNTRGFPYGTSSEDAKERQDFLDGAA